MTAARERPILFSGPMVRALLAGRKTQTRRVVKNLPVAAVEARRATTVPAHWFTDTGGQSTMIACPCGAPGDRLWVKETHAIVPRTAYAMSEGVPQTLRPDDDHDAAVYAADWERSKPGRWRPSIHMPRWASRLTLEITDVRVERLHAITETDAEAEGVREPSIGPIHMVSPERCGEIDRAKAPALFLWEMLWRSINGTDSWNANPWVWVVTFKVVR